MRITKIAPNGASKKYLNKRLKTLALATIGLISAVPASAIAAVHVAPIVAATTKKHPKTLEDYSKEIPLLSSKNYTFKLDGDDSPIKNLTNVIKNGTSDDSKIHSLSFDYLDKQVNGEFIETKNSINGSFSVTNTKDGKTANYDLNSAFEDGRWKINLKDKGKNLSSTYYAQIKEESPNYLSVTDKDGQVVLKQGFKDRFPNPIIIAAILVGICLLSCGVASAAAVLNKN